jgi:hypothetical protein
MNAAAASTHQRRSTAERRPRRPRFVARLRRAGFEEREVRRATKNDSAASRTFL